MREQNIVATSDALFKTGSTTLWRFGLLCINWGFYTTDCMTTGTCSSLQVFIFYNICLGAYKRVQLIKSVQLSQSVSVKMCVDIVAAHTWGEFNLKQLRFFKSPYLDHYQFSRLCMQIILSFLITFPLYISFAIQRFFSSVVLFVCFLLCTPRKLWTLAGKCWLKA